MCNISIDLPQAIHCAPFKEELTSNANITVVRTAILQGGLLIPMFGSYSRAMKDPFDLMTPKMLGNKVLKT